MCENISHEALEKGNELREKLLLVKSCLWEVYLTFKQWKAKKTVVTEDVILAYLDTRMSNMFVLCSVMKCL